MSAVEPDRFHSQPNLLIAFTMQRGGRSLPDIVWNLCRDQEKAIPAAIRSTRPIAGITQVFFLMNEDIRSSNFADSQTALWPIFSLWRISF
jgi:uncharacterized membrane protein